MDRRVFFKNGSYCVVVRDVGEIYESFIERGYFIISHITDTDNYERIVTMSRVWANMKNDNCVYDFSIENILKK